MMGCECFKVSYKKKVVLVIKPSMGKGFDYWDPMAVVVSVVICIFASFSMKGSSRFNSVATIIHIGVLLFIIIAGSTKDNLSNFDPLSPFDFKGILKASSVIFFAYVGFDGVATLGEETKKPGRDIVDADFVSDACRID
ncbi:putative amino acid/polyamine transporter I [Helianthus annuus]|nr:putative amino acid/polyamine transporter I [Helianthus annuus]